MALIDREPVLKHHPVARRTTINVVLFVLLPVTFVLSFAAHGDRDIPGDVAVSRWVQQAGIPGAGAIEMIGYWLGSLPGIALSTAVAAVALILGRHFVEALLALGIALARALNPVLKWVYESPRPTEEAVRVTEIATNYGYPSGHAMGVVMIYGGIIYLSQLLIHRTWLRLLIQGVSIIAILITGFARIHSGAHWFTDVVGGVVWGTLILFILIRIDQEIRRPHLG